MSRTLLYLLPLVGPIFDRTLLPGWRRSVSAQRWPTNPGWCWLPVPLVASQ